MKDIENHYDSSIDEPQDYIGKHLQSDNFNALTGNGKLCEAHLPNIL